MNGSGRYSIPRLYYLMTPAFIALDYWAGVNVRVAVLDGLPPYKNLYYGFCVLCGLVVYLLPAASAIVALFESSINILLIVLGIFLPYVQTIMRYDPLMQQQDPTAVFEVSYGINLVLAGIVVVIAFKESSEILNRQFTDATVGQHDHGPERR